MRIRRTVRVLASLAIGATGALVADPVLAVAAAAPAAVAASPAKLNAMGYHGGQTACLWRDSGGSAVRPSGTA
jgi:hypothetical protein